MSKKRKADTYGPSIGLKVELATSKTSCYRLYNTKTFLFDYVHIIPEKGVIKIEASAVAK